MIWLRVVALRIREMFRKRQLNAEMDEELQSHVEMLTEENMQRGMSADEARRAAKIALGGVEQVREAVRDQRGLRFLESFVADVRFGVRMLQKNPGFTVVAVLTLALGIGSVTAIFAVVDSVLLRPLPYPHAERIVKVGSVFRGGLYSDSMIEGTHYQFLQENSRSFEAMEVHDVVTSGATVSGGSEPEHLVSASVSAGFFDVLGVAPSLGRAFTKEEDRPGGPCAVVLTDGFWHRRYAGDPAIVGQSITLNDESCLVTGVLPASFRFDQDADILVSIRVPAIPESGHSYYMLARLKPGVTLDQARAEMPALFARFKAAHGDLIEGGETGIEVKPYLDWMVSGVRPSLWLLLGAVGLVLLMTCANVANLLLLRAASRTREMAVRTALGAERRRLARQLLTESVLLACAGGGCGLLIARWGLSAARHMIPATLPRAADISINLTVAGFALFLSMFTVAIFGLVPALHASRVDINTSLKAAGDRSGTEVGRARTRALLVGIEVALSTILLTGAVLFMRGFVVLRDVPPGFDPTNVLTFRMSPLPRYSTTARLWDFEQQVLTRLGALPSVETAASAICLPFQIGPDMPSAVLGEQQPIAFNPRYRTVSPDYFRSLKIPILRGRPFAITDTSDAMPVIIINESVARQVFKGRDPLGEHIQLGVGLGAEYADPPRVVIGVAGDVRETSLDQPGRIAVFIPRSQVPNSLTAPINRLVGSSWAVRTKIPPGELAATVRRAILAVDPEQPISNVSTMEQMLSADVERQRFALLLMILFAGLGVLLTAVGIYGVISYGVAQRTHEIGIRMALGERRGNVLRMIIGNGMKLALIGIVIGIVASLAMAHVLSSLLFGVRPTDPTTFAGVTLLVAAVALIACYVPARRATKVDPMVALRHE